MYTSILLLKNNIQFNINKLYDWLNVNKLSLNISKTNVLLFNIKNRNRNINLDLNINNIKVRQIAILHKVKNKLNMKYLI